jgi:cytochrome c biogenesis protein CcmG/thiol:disulfide interchange protein DsbE
MKLGAEDIVALHGLNYKDRPEDAARWLAELGDPYRRTGADIDGRVGIDWGVYGVPETFIIDKRGVIRSKVIGAITPRIVEQRLLPLVRQLQAE